MLSDLVSVPLGELLSRAAANWPDRPAMHGLHRSWTWSQLDAEVDRAVARLAGIGVRAGDRVAFVMEKRPEVVVGFLACARLGAVYVPVNHKLHPDQVGDQFRTVGVSAVVLEPGQDGVLVGVDPPVSRVLYVDGPGRLGSEMWQDEPVSWRPTFRPDADTPCYLNYTSGSTGRPKGATTTHRNINANAVSTIDGLGFEGGDTYLGMFSVFAHPHELFHRSILVGGAFVVADTLNPRVAAELIARHRISWTMGVPSFYEMLLDFRAAHGGDYGSLRVLEAGGAFVGPETLERMEQAFAARFSPVWGSTETTGVGLGMRARGPRRPGSTGTVMPGYQLRVVREDGGEAPAGEVGELWMRGEAVVSGYDGMPEETAAQFQDGWYATRDLVRLDEDGFVFFAGRRSEMLKIGGIRVFPLEIEQVVLQHPEVAGVVVVRGEDRLRGEIARAVVQVVASSTLTVRALQGWCRERMATYKVPRIVEFWAEIPRMPNGKVDKKAVLAVAPDPTRDERR
jgi:acyl-CoA synthetase (AMP-forming)/AMP-acid ligase II